jgi:hypothetical protein
MRRPAERARRGRGLRADEGPRVNHLAEPATARTRRTGKGLARGGCGIR